MTDYQLIASWLRKKAAAEAAMSFFSGALIFAGGLVMVVISYGAAYVLIWAVSWMCVTSGTALFSDHAVHVSHAVLMTAAAFLTGALFVGNARLRRVYSRRRARHPAPVEFGGRSPGTLVHLLAFPGASNRELSDIIFVGPRLTTIGFDQIKKAARLWHLDVGACSRLLGVLASHHSKVSVSELGRICGIPRATEVLLRLADIQGVVLLNREPAGATLTSELRRELNSLGGVPSQASVNDVDRTTPREAPDRLHELLGLSRTATLEEFEAAYRKWIRESARGSAGTRPQLDRNVEAVKAAYEALIRQYGQRSEEARRKVEQVWEQYKRPGR